jgi:hypothetical protein
MQGVPDHTLDPESVTNFPPPADWLAGFISRVQ